MPQRMRVLIVDDQTLVREGFRKLLELEPDVEVVGTAADGEEALAAVEHLHQASLLPDVILMDIRMPRMDGIAATKALRAKWPDAHIVILTTFDDVRTHPCWPARRSPWLLAQRHYCRTACDDHTHSSKRAGASAARSSQESVRRTDTKCCIQYFPASILIDASSIVLYSESPC